MMTIASPVFHSAVSEIASRAGGPRSQGAHTIEFWLAVLTAVGILAFGWACVVLRAVNRFCRDARDPAKRTEWAVADLEGRRLPPRDASISWLFRHTHAGTWSRERLLLGEWTAGGTLLGATCGFLAYLLQG